MGNSEEETLPYIAGLGQGQKASKALVGFTLKIGARYYPHLLTYFVNVKAINGSRFKYQHSEILK